MKDRMFTAIRWVLIVTVLTAAYAAVAFAVAVPQLWFLYVVLLIVAAGKGPELLTAYGTARVATADDMPDMVEGEDGILLGEIDAPVTKAQGVKALFDFRASARASAGKCLKSFWRKQPPLRVRLNDEVHLMCCAPSGAGKGASFVIPQLLSCKDSTVSLDFKGELALATAAARAAMGHDVIVIDPFGLVGGTDTLNPIGDIDPSSPTAPDECRDVAAEIIDRSGTEHEPFWNNASEAELATAIGFVVCYAEPQDKHLQSVRKLLSDSARRQQMIEACCRSDAWDGILARWGHQSSQLRDKTLDSVMANLHTHMRFLDSISVARNTVSSTFDPADLVRKKVSVYLVLPPEHIKAQRGLLRLWVGALLRAVMKGGLQERHKVRFFLDEAASLGRMECIDQALSISRSYGCRLQMYFQSLGQTKTIWPEDGGQTLLSNTTQIFFAVNDWQTAEYVSNRLGEYTQVVTSGGTSTSRTHQPSKDGGSYSHSTSTNSNWSQAARKIADPAEVLAADPRLCFTFTPGRRPIISWLSRYYEPGFNADRGIGLFRAAFDTAVLFFGVLTLAVIATAAATGILK